MGIEQKLEIVHTKDKTIIGYVTEASTYLRISHGAIINTESDKPADLAFEYFCEKAKRNLRVYDIPLNAVEMKTQDPQIDTLLNAYAEMSKVANKGAFGKYTINRLKKLLGR